MVTPILTTKLHIPSLPRSLVPRERLLDRLDQGLRRGLTLVSAPAGFGKTTLLGEWLQRLEAVKTPPVQVAWVSLDDGDNDPARFGMYLAAALRQAGEGRGPVGDDAATPAGPVLQESYLIGLINEVAVLPRTIVLVLDDYHAIASPGVHDAVAFLVEHLPENLHLVIATRADPPLPLPRLRARGHLVELRQSDLCFTAAEAAIFLNDAMGLGLSAQDVAALEARTEGWIAGLQMAALSLQSKERCGDLRSEFVQALTSSHRYILDYLVEEVLERQPAALQAFLVRTSILEQLCGPLCDAVVGEAGSGALSEPIASAGSQSILEHLEAANLFIVPLDDERHWYRYHRLFADLLRKRLGQASPELISELHRRASVWYEQQGLAGDAIDHSLAAHDAERAADLIDAQAEGTLMRSEVTTLLRWVERLPDASVRRRPTLCFHHAWALLMGGCSLVAVGERLRDLAQACKAFERSGAIAARMAALQAYLMLFRADVDGAAALCQQALPQLPESDRFLRSVLTWILSLAHLSGEDMHDGERALAEAVRIAQEAGNPLIAVSALCYQARLQMRQGRLHRAHELLARALELATDPRGRRLPVASKALTGLGELAREWNDLEAAENYLTEGIEVAKAWGELVAFDAYYPLARTRLAQGDAVGAREALETAREIAYRSEATDSDDLVADLQLAFLSAQQGDAIGVMRWAERRGLMPGISPEQGPPLDEGQARAHAHLLKYERLVLARLFRRQGRAAEALGLLEDLLVEARGLARVDLTIQVQVLRALAWQAQGDDSEALEALTEALSLAGPGGYRP